MSGLNIDHGGAISVDPAAMREAASRIAALAADFDRAREAVVNAYRAVLGSIGAETCVDTAALWTAGERMARLRDECEDAGAGTRLMADVFEYVELQVEAEAMALHDQAGADRLRQRMEELAASDARIADMAAMRVADWRGDRFEGLDEQGDWGGLLGPLFGLVSLVGSGSGRGTVWPWMRLSGTADPVTVTPVSTTSPARAPSGLRDALERMPNTGAGAQVAVEKLVMPGGRTTYIAYVAGTQSALAGGREPWDMTSNQQLYSGQMSASYQATVDALAAAGAKPGDEVDIVAHSQAGMIASYLSHQSGFDVKLQISVGSPVVDVADADQTLIRLAHTDDPVYRLSDGGTAAASGSPGSFVATREDEPASVLTDPWDPHLMESYLDLATEVELSGDPRVQALDTFWDDFGRAVSVERIEYHAERVG
ncbi:MAG: hypothetical protein J7484_06085 [Microbacterium sp.]|nr:hypothetical protein [Microbacterium sp.]